MQRQMVEKYWSDVEYEGHIKVLGVSVYKYNPGCL